MPVLVPKFQNAGRKTVFVCLSHGFGTEKVFIFVTFFIRKQRFDAYLFFRRQVVQKKSCIFAISF